MVNRVALILIGVVALSACGDKIVLVDRPGCVACHRPLQPNGTPHGIEQAHPPVNGKELSCVDCHGGDEKSRVQATAHVSPGNNAAGYIRNLTIGELDDVDDAYLRFINPGDLRIAKQTCGSAGCHPSIVDKMVTNQMSTFSGELGVARYRAGEQNSGASVKGIYDVRDTTFIFGEIPGTVGSLDKMEEPRIQGTETKIGPYQDLYLTKACMRCHTWSFGDNKFPGDFRSSGCTSCHMTYADDGLSKSDDPVIDKDSPPHPLKHVLTKAPPTDQCTHCHYRGGRIGLTYQGFREGAGAGFDPPRAQYVNKALHGHDASFYIEDEDAANDYDETPPDVHFEAGMHCVDCHGNHDVHGDGHLYTSTNLAVEIKCEDCHGTNDKEATLVTRLGNKLSHMERDANGDVWLTTKVGNKRLQVPQIKKSLEAADPSSFLHASMGRDSNGFSHVDNLSCNSCHSGWMPNCYGCHIDVDMRDPQRSLISGVSTPGRIKGSRKWVAVSDLILMIDNVGKISPSMPSERMFVTVTNGAGEKVIDKKIRTGPGGEPGMGHRAFAPHSVRRWSPFMLCQRCHPMADGSNQQTVDVAMGFGSDRYPEVDGDGKTWFLDRLQTKAYAYEVLIGNDQPEESRPLPQSIVEKVMGVTVIGTGCSSPPTLTTIQDAIFTPTCATLGCHDSVTKAEGLNLTKGAARASLVNVGSTLEPSRKLVVPGSDAQSYLINKISTNTNNRDGRRMPSKRAPLLDCQVEMIRTWINAGAQE